MRRGLAILLALLFGVGPLSSALPGAEDASLPACCRRQGAHHCAMAAHVAAMMAAAESDGKTSVSAPITCPYYPGTMFALLLPAVHALTAQAVAPLAVTIIGPALLPADSVDVSGPRRTHAGRGPPTAS